MKLTTATLGGCTLATAFLLSTTGLNAEAIPITGVGRAQPVPSAIPGDPIESLTQEQLQEAFRVLSQHYIEHGSLTYEQLNKAALEGLMRRLSFGAELVPRKSVSKKDEEVPFSFYHEVIDGRVAYIRPVTFNDKEVSKTAALLKKHAKDKKVSTLILDLRAPVEQFEFARAANFADLFTGSNELLFKIKKPSDQKARLFLSKKPNLWNKRLLILVDRETSSVAETIAAVIDQQAECFVIGEATPGRAVQYQEIPLNKATNLRFASAEVLLKNDKALFRKGVTPDLVCKTSSNRKRRVFEASEEKGLVKFVIDDERPRLNEAALVAGTDPELDYYLARSAGETTSYDKKRLQDRTLQTALESLIAFDFLKLPEQPAEEEDQAEEEPEDKPEEKEDSPTEPEEKKKAA